MNAIAPLKQAVKSTLSAISHWRVPRIEPVVIATVAHDTTAFTQGLACSNGNLYESTGGETTSTLRRLNGRDGGVEMLVPIHDDFAEGIAVVGDRLFQLSWQSETAREFKIPDLRLVATHKYRGQGWGLAAVGDRLIASDGTNQLCWYDTRFRRQDALRVTSNGLPISWLNDLETVGECIYANIVASPFILEIDSATGRARRLIDCQGLFDHEAELAPHQIMNGIAYCRERDAFYVTGKNWRSMHLIRIPQ